MLSTTEVTIERAVGDGVIKDAAGFFARAFWPSFDQLSDEQVGQLSDEHQRDFDRRYAELTGKRRFPSALLIAHDGESILGCAGVEMTVIDPIANAFWDREQAETFFSDKFAGMGGRERSQYRKASLAELSSAFLETQAVRPVLSNLAVRPDTRGTGLGARLVKSCEELVGSADGWGGDDLWLLVEELNTPAVKLYERLGFETVWTQPSRVTRVASANSGSKLEVSTAEATLLAMAKQLQS